VSFATDQMKKELEGYVMLAPKVKQELDEAMKDVARASERINELIKEGTVKREYKEVVRYHDVN